MFWVEEQHEQACTHIAYKRTRMFARAGFARGWGRTCKHFGTVRLRICSLWPLASATVLAKLTVLSRQSSGEDLCDVRQWGKRRLQESFVPPVVSRFNEAHTHSRSGILMTEAFWLSLNIPKLCWSVWKFVMLYLISFYCTEIRSPWWNSGIDTVQELHPAKQITV